MTKQEIANLLNKEIKPLLPEGVRYEAVVDDEGWLNTYLGSDQQGNLELLAKARRITDEIETRVFQAYREFLT